MYTTKSARPSKPYNLFSTFLSPFYLPQFQLRPRRQGRLGHAPERVIANAAPEVEVRKFLVGGGETYGKDPEGGTASMTCRGGEPNQGTLPFNQVECPKSTGGQQESKSHNLADLPEASQFHIPVRRQLAHQIYQSQSILAKY